MPIPQVPHGAIAATQQPSASDLAALMRGGAAERFGAGVRLACKPNAPFFLRHRAQLWEVETAGLDGPTWLPELAPFPLVPGVSGVRTLQRGEEPVEAFREAVSREQTHEGWVFIDPGEIIAPEYLPDGVPGGAGYLREIPCADPRSRMSGSRYLECWDVPLAVPVGEEQRFQRAIDKYNRWRLHLVQIGRVQPPPEYILQRLIQRVERRLARQMQDMGMPPETRDAHVTRTRARLEAMRNAARPWEQPTASPAQPPAKSGRKEVA